MNIFYLATDPRVCAEYHCDKHVVKMILETTQLLSTALHETNHVPRFRIYKSTHKNHPCAKWVRESSRHYHWLVDLGLELCKEYTYRYGKIHKSQEILENLKTYSVDLEDNGWHNPPQAMPDEFKCNHTVIAYQRYYRVAKKDILSYKKRPYPHFLCS